MLIETDIIFGYQGTLLASASVINRFCYYDVDFDVVFVDCSTGEKGT